MDRKDTAIFVITVVKDKKSFLKLLEKVIPLPRGEPVLREVGTNQ